MKKMKIILSEPKQVGKENMAGTVGYVETKDDVWFFSTNIDTKTKDDLPKRKAITLEILKIKGIIK